MPSPGARLRRRFKRLYRDLRGAREVVRAMVSTDHPFLAHIIPMRRCNLACTYCNEFDDFSKPVALEEMCQRIDQLGALGTTIMTISGGEPLLHPELDDVIRRIRKNGMIVGHDHKWIFSGPPSASSASIAPAWSGCRFPSITSRPTTSPRKA